MPQGLEWHVSGKQDFLVRIGREVQRHGSPIQAITSIMLEKQVGTQPDVWESVGVSPEFISVVADNFDANNPIANAAVYFEKNADVDGDPVVGLAYRWHLVILLANGLNVVVKAPVDLVP